MTETQIALLLALMFALYFLAFLIRVFWRPKRHVTPKPERAIMVDGSNVMHWGGEPSLVVLYRVIGALQEEGLVPYICFDANVGYKLSERYMSSRDLAPLLNMEARQIYVVDKGVVADGVLLDLATENDLSIVTNDRFRDWRDQYPWVKDHRRFRRGRWQAGNLVWGTK